MLKSLTATLELSEIGEKLNDLNAVAEPTEAQQTEERDLLAAQKKKAAEYREALQSEDDARTTPTEADAETRERLQLVSRASLGAIFSAVIEHRSTSGAESELQAALHLMPTQVPIDLLRAPVGRTRDHAGADARGRQRASGADADLRGRGRGVSECGSSDRPER